MKKEVDLISVENGVPTEVKIDNIVYYLVSKNNFPIVNMKSSTKTITKTSEKKNPKIYKRKYERKVQTPKVEGLECAHCGSTNYVKYGKRNRKQLYKCKDCERKFVDNKAELELKTEIKEYILKLHNKGDSSRKISRKIRRKYKFVVTHSTVIRWIKEQEK